MRPEVGLLRSAREAAARPLAGTVALVTGASRGIGAEVALQLGALGADLALVQRGSAADTARRALPHDVRVESIRADLVDPHAAAGAVEEAIGRLGRLDVLVCNAGQIHREPALEVRIERFAEIVAIDLVAPFALAQAAARHFVESGRGGRIVFVSSVLGFQGGLNVSSYAASKAGLTNLVRALANEWAVHGIAVNAVAPGYVENEQTVAVRADPVRRRQIDERIPAGRWAFEAEIASAVVLLAGTALPYVNGHTLVVDGGWLGR